MKINFDPNNPHWHVTRAEFERNGTREVGVLIKDNNFEIGEEIRDRLGNSTRGRPFLFMVGKRKPTNNP